MLGKEINLHRQSSFLWLWNVEGRDEMDAYTDGATTNMGIFVWQLFEMQSRERTRNKQ